MFNDTKPEYISLAAHPDEEEIEDSDDGPSSAQHKSKTLSLPSMDFIIPRPMLYAALLIVFLSALNIALLPVTITKYTSISLTQTELDALPYPPQVLGLERAAKKMPPPPEWNRAWPSHTARLSQKLKNSVYGESVQVFISVEDSTIMRFPIPASKSSSRSCAVTWTPPPKLSARARDLQTKGDITEIEVWSIIAPNALQSSASRSVKDINFDTLSWNTRPVRGELLGTVALNARPNSTTIEFGCPEEREDLVVELRCLRVACEVKFKQIRMSPKLGFELVRRA